MELFRPRIIKIQACKVAALIGNRRMHPLFHEQLVRVQELDNAELIRFRIEDPISVTKRPAGHSLTGGHHRTDEIDNRVKDGRLQADTLVEILLHD